MGILTPLDQVKIDAIAIGRKGIKCKCNGVKGMKECPDADKSDSDSPQSRDSQSDHGSAASSSGYDADDTAGEPIISDSGTHSESLEDGRQARSPIIPYFTSDSESNSDSLEDWEQVYSGEIKPSESASRASQWYRSSESRPPASRAPAPYANYPPENPFSPQPGPPASLAVYFNGGHHSGHMSGQNTPSPSPFGHEMLPSPLPMPIYGNFGYQPPPPHQQHMPYYPQPWPPVKRDGSATGDSELGKILLTINTEYQKAKREIPSQEVATASSEGAERQAKQKADAGAYAAKREAEEKAYWEEKIKEEKKRAMEAFEEEKKADQERAAEKRKRAEENKAAWEEKCDETVEKAVEKANKEAEASKKKPIKFKDAVGRKFSFPFHLCATWAGMEDIIKQAFLDIPIIGPHVLDCHYDLIGPNGEIILPQLWETMIEPDWSISMHMWPMPKNPPLGGTPPPPLGRPPNSPPPPRPGAGPY